MITYSDYERLCVKQNQPGFSLSQLQSIYDEMIDNIKAGDETTEGLAKSMCQQACKYAEYRMNWEFYSLEERIEKDSYRTSCHNAFIDQINILDRYIKRSIPNSAWREQLTGNRKTIGDFACFVTFMIGISNR